MGASTFSNTVTRTDQINTPRKAFDVAVEQAQYDHGHSGYSGSIAEKSTFDVVKPREGESNHQCIERGLEHEFSDKWGPAGCIVTDQAYHFFGWASE